jgi:alkylhydroperoxidase family enzyme
MGLEALSTYIECMMNSTCTSAFEYATNHQSRIANAPTLLPLLLQQGLVQYTRLALTTRLRELVILYSSLRFESSYEHQHHITVSQSYVTDTQRAEIEKTAGDSTYFLQGKTEPGVFSPQELAMLKFLEATINSPTVDEAVFREAKEHLSDRQMVEVVILQVC